MPWQNTLTAAPSDLQVNCIVARCARGHHGSVYAIAKTKVGWQRLTVGCIATLFVVYACSGGDSPTKATPEGNDAASDPESNDVGTPTTDTATNNTSVLTAAFLPYGKVSTRYRRFKYCSAARTPWDHPHLLVARLTSASAQRAWVRRGASALRRRHSRNSDNPGRKADVQARPAR